MPPVVYTWRCKLCCRRGGGNFNHVIESIDSHLQTTHHILWKDYEGRYLREFVEELKRLIPSLDGEEGIVQMSLKEGTVIYDKTLKAWVLITPLFEVAQHIPNEPISEEEREEARREEKERLKEERKERIEWKRWKYRKRYCHYHQRYYDDYFKRKASHSLQSLHSNIKQAEEFRLWSEYHSLKPFIDSLSSQELERFKEVEEKLKKLSVRPPTPQELLKIEIEHFSPSP